MDLQKYSDDQIVSGLKRTVARENHHLAQTLVLLNEVSERRIHLALGYRSLFDFCQSKLGLSEGSIYRRTQVATKIMTYPLLLELIRGSKINLTVASVICPHLEKVKDSSAFINSFVGKTKRDAELMLMDQNVPRKTPKDRIRPVCKRPLAQVDMPKLEQTKKKSIEPLTEIVHQISFAAGDRVVNKLETVKNLLSNKFPDGKLENVIETMLDHYIASSAKPPRPRKAGPKPKSRYIPKSLAHKIKNRALGQCEFVGQDGRRCNSGKYLVIDHIRPLSLGGQTTEENLQCLCSAHNRYKAEQDHGREFIKNKVAS